MVLQGEDGNKTFNLDINNTTLGQVLEMAEISEITGVRVRTNNEIIYSKSAFVGKQGETNVLLADLLKGEKKINYFFVMMLYVSSGRTGFDFYQDKSIQGNIERDVLAKMYQRENELRLSEETQLKMDECLSSGTMNSYALLLDEIQIQVLREFGFKGTEEDLSLFRQSLGLYAEDKELQSIPYYSKFNRARDGDLKVGDLVEDVQLSHINPKQGMTSLFSFYRQRVKEMNLKEGAPLVIVTHFFF